jgi:hypothetical protein
MGRLMRIFLLGFFVLVVSATPLLAKGGGGNGGGNHRGGGGGGNCVPEIDPSLAPSAIALLSGGLLIIKSKTGKKDKKE